MNLTMNNMIAFSFILLLHLSSGQSARRYTGDGDICWHIARDNCTGTDNGPFAYLQTLQHRRARPNECAGSYFHTSGNIHTGHDRYKVSQFYVVPDRCVEIDDNKLAN